MSLSNSNKNKIKELQLTPKKQLITVNSFNKAGISNTFAEAGAMVSKESFNEGKNWINQDWGGVGKNADGSHKLSGTTTMGLATSAGGIVGTALETFKNSSQLADTTAQENQIKQAGALTTNAQSNADLLNDWKNRTVAMGTSQNALLSAGNGKLNRGLGVGIGTLKGAAEGAKSGGMWGAIIGAAASLGAGIGGIFTARSKARKKANQMNNMAAAANANSLATLTNQADVIAQQNKLMQMANYSALGGYLENFNKNR